ncbi:MAG: hypothetical protein PHD11_04315 [Bacteroidales bacterium]|nr:hypothetical protein [Bacteroidales bacterium]MDD4670477.1 hypothetical protein [Bacteroidales bacterium]
MKLKKSHSISDDELTNVTGGADPYDSFCNSFKNEGECNSHYSDGSCVWEDFYKAGFVCIKK